MKELKNNGMVAIYIPPGLLEMVESTRKQLKMNRSRFIQYCITKTLQELNVLSQTVHKS
jgi:metal-responsive CopG/Arc/MetJ family transcriptional regulator